MEQDIKLNDFLKEILKEILERIHPTNPVLG
jgi:hypothetical protein